MKLYPMLVTFFAALALPASTLAQANVTENQTTNVYVDASSGSDGNPGTQASPFLTIGKAATTAESNNVSGVGTRVLVNPGIYREFLNIQPTSGQTSAPITFQASQTGTAIIAGSDVLTGWASGGDSVYTHPWTHNRGSCSVPSGWPSGIAPAVLRTEMIVVNGTPLTQVLSLSLMREGTFLLDEAASVVHVWPASGTDMASAKVEAAVRPETLAVSGRTNMVFRGLIFSEAASCINQTGANISSSSNILLDTIQANWNNWGGLGIHSSNLITLRNSVANDNGGVGFSTYRTRNALYQSDETDYNNWRGAMGALYDWGMGGFKLFAAHTATADQISAYRNQAQGLWFDTDDKNISISNAKLAENVLANLQLERNEGPISLTGSSLCSGGIGVNLVNSAKLTATGNTFYNNGGTNKGQGQIFLAGKAGGRQQSDWETGQNYNLFTENTALSNNVVADATPGQFVFATYLAGSDWTRFTGTLASNNNAWSDGTAINKFSVANGFLVDLPGWQADTGGDHASSWSSITQSTSLCGVPAAGFSDFHVNLDKRSYSMSAGTATIKLQVNSYGYGPVSLAVAGLPANVTASYSQNSLISGAPVLTLTASSTAANQTVPITIIASSGSRVHTVEVALHVMHA